MADRDYIAYYLNGGTRSRFLSGPVKNLVDQQWQFTLSLPIRDAAGANVNLHITISADEPEVIAVQPAPEQAPQAEEPNVEVPTV